MSWPIMDNDEKLQVVHWKSREENRAITHLRESRDGSHRDLG
jgi:hypothetical protein